jgi:nitrogen fixation NifU-like protein
MLCANRLKNAGDFSMANIEEIYSDIILELARHPLNKGILIKANAHFSDTNPFCGDKIEMQLLIKNKKIKEISFQGEGCAISQATASVLTELVKGKSLDAALAISLDSLLKELNLQSLKHNAARIKCAALSLKALKMAIYHYLGKKQEVSWNDVTSA